MAVRRFKNPLPLTLSDATSERVRQNQDERIRELQRAVEELLAARVTTSPWELIRRHTLTAAQATAVFENLHGDDDAEYRVRGYILGATGQIRLQTGGLSSGTVRSQRVSGRGSAASAFSNTSHLFIAYNATTANPTAILFDGKLWAASGGIRAWLCESTELDITTPSVSADLISGYNTDTTSEITSLTVDTSAGTLGAGSTFELYRRAR